MKIKISQSEIDKIKETFNKVSPKQSNEDKKEEESNLKIIRRLLY